ncbi:MAG: hypothetical protein HOC91_11375 [Nitrospinaceae bacterium]|jgi:hypothetical protein|nr:hypothetical protein [Nitrospinaceae bacterium]MBT3433648.1 hypothetical protein [Nitrospinaceae bacterium]MBT3822877.1 hypothetical protein [Nitrospinaceae bacterium]MBT4095888.1 hypothetical protein [Nitrospinaceae bacterium]MBT4431107.1 hypothetical protein [Nitrospinaceae bacterium]
MHTLKVRKVIELPADEVWEAVSEENKGNQNYMDSIGETLGAKVAEWVEGEGVQTSLYNITIPLNKAKACLSVRQAGAGESEITVSMSYRAGWGPLGGLVNAILIGPAMRKAIGKTLENALPSGGSAGAPVKVRERVGTLMEAKLVLAA